jgi:twitching motility protein PilI
MARAGKVDLRVFQQELAARLASKTTAQVESSRLGLASAGRQWLVRLADAGEVIATPHIVPVPLTKPWFVGVANIRGNLYGVVDFAGFLGGDAATPHATSAGSRLMLFGPRVGELRAGILVPQVLGLRNLSALTPVGRPADARAWFSERWIDNSGGEWQEIDLTCLAQDPEFLQVGI